MLFVRAAYSPSPGPKLCNQFYPTRILDKNPQQLSEAILFKSTQCGADHLKKN